MFNLRRIRQAVHGRGDNWIEVGPSTAPSSFSASTTTPEMQLGGRWRGNMPGSGDQHINDDSDKGGKSTHGDASKGDFDPDGKNNAINDKLESGQDKCIITYVVRDGENPMDKAKEIGKGGKIKPRIEGNTLVIEVEGLTSAAGIQAKLPGAVITIKQK